MAAIHHAVALARRGLKVFPLCPKGTKSKTGRPLNKTPAISGWQQAAASDLLAVADLFASRPSANVGVLTDGLVVLDVDAHKAGLDILPTIGALPPTYTVRTPRGGLHIYYSSHVLISGGTDIWPGIDVRATGNLCVGVGSETEHGAYTTELDAPIAAAPDWLIAQLSARGKPRDAAPRQTAHVGSVDDAAAIKAARAHIMSAPASAEGSRAVDAYRVACRAMDYGVSVETCLDLMRDHWRCDPPLDDAELEHQVRSAADYRREPAGIDNPRDGLDAITTDCPLEARSWTANDTDVAASARIARPWIIPRRLVKQIISVMISPGGVGKSTLSLAWALAVAGTPAAADRLGVHVRQHGNVLVVNAEDPLLEMQRRLAGITQRYSISLDGMPHKLRMISGADDPLLFMRLQGTKQGVRLYETELVKQLSDYVRRHQISVLMLDPLIEMHEADENNNAQMRAVVGAFRRIAVETDCAVLIVHHTRKSGVDSDGHAGNADSGRGASATSNASRIVFTLFGMSKHDAERYGIAASERHLYVRLDDAKFNLGLASPNATWYRREGVSLESGESMGVLVAAELTEVKADEDRAIRMLIAEHLSQRPRITLSELCDAMLTDPILSGMSRAVLAKRVRALLGDQTTVGNRRVVLSGSGLSDGVVTVTAVS